MWLINTTTLQREYLENVEEIDYAILSHVWQDAEVNFQELAGLIHSSHPGGLSKIQRTCERARERGIMYAWVDTCCIDKRNSAELAEAINLMFHWYQNSSVCFAYLSDLPSTNSVADLAEQLPHCRWFTRGWTLQELVAPMKVEFYDQNWHLVGDKVALQSLLSSITRIDPEVLVDSDFLRTISVARRMSWASERKTTRQEDLAYCLFGLFDVNLPLIYGEGRKAFFRLQEEIIKQSNDISVFAWEAEDDEPKYQGCLARSPSNYRRGNRLFRDMDPSLFNVYKLTNRGLQVTAELAIDPSDEDGTYLLKLHCHDGQNDLYLRLLPTSDGFVRFGSKSLMPTGRPLLRASHTSPTIYIPRSIRAGEAALLDINLAHRFKFRIDNRSSWMQPKDSPMRCTPNHLWDHLSSSFNTVGFDGFSATICMKFRGNPDSAVALRNTSYVEFDIGVDFGLLANGPSENSRPDRTPLIPWARLYQRKDQSFELLPKGLVRANSAPLEIDPSRLPLESHDPSQPHTVSQQPIRSPLVGIRIKVSVSTNVSINRESGMYEAVLLIEEKQTPFSPHA